MEKALFMYVSWVQWMANLMNKYLWMAINLIQKYNVFDTKILGCKKICNLKISGSGKSMKTVTI